MRNRVIIGPLATIVIPQADQTENVGCLRRSGGVVADLPSGTYHGLETFGDFDPALRPK